MATTMDTSTPRIVLADPQTLTIEGLRQLLEPSFRVIAAATDGRELLEAAERERPDLVLCEIDLPGLDGIEVTRQLKGRDPTQRVLILSSHTEAFRVRDAFEAGAAGYLAKSSAPEELEFALREVLKGRHYLSPSIAYTLVPGMPAAEAPPIRVLVVDDHFVVRKGTAACLVQEDDIDVVGEATNGREAVEAASRLRPDVILMDLQMPEMDGGEATREILQLLPATRILLMTRVSANEGEVLDAIRAGAVGYFHKTSEDLPGVIRRVHGGERVVPPEVMERLETAPSLDDHVLTPREKDATRLVARGLANKEIANELGVSQLTIRTHLRNIFEKLGLSNRVELALYAVRTGLVEL